MSGAVVLHHPNRTATAVAEGLVATWRRRGTVVDAVALPTAPTPGTQVEHLLVVTPVLGDERLPDVSEAGVQAWGACARTHRVLLTGDFRTGQTVSPVADEADRLLASAGSTACAPPFLIDTPVLFDDLWPVLERELSRQELVARPAPLPRPAQEHAEEPLRRLAALLPVPPQVRVDQAGRCVALSFVDASPYPRSTLPERAAEVLALAGELPALRSLGLPFAGLRELPATLPPQLHALDLRGNLLQSYAALAGQPQLRALNLAACDLAQVPVEVAQLSGLHTLVLAKNRLTDPLPGLCGLSGLRRLTLYRNQVASLGPALAGLRELRLLNVGANPLAELPPALADLAALEVLGLRMLPLARLPDELVRLPRLRQVDASKTCASVPPELSARVRLTDGMPRWAWDDVAEDPPASPAPAAGPRPAVARPARQPARAAGGPPPR